jgi:hypothetical protein
VENETFRNLIYDSERAAAYYVMFMMMSYSDAKVACVLACKHTSLKVWIMFRMDVKIGGLWRYTLWSHAISQPPSRSHRVTTQRTTIRIFRDMKTKKLMCVSWESSITGCKGEYLDKIEKVEEGWRKLHNKKLHNLWFLPYIIRVSKSGRMRWVCSMQGEDEKCIRNVNRKTWRKAIPWKTQARTERCH